MVLHSSGDDIQIRENDGNWVPISDVYFEEGKSYEWKCHFSVFKLVVNFIPIPMTKVENGWFGVVEMPFQVGQLNIDYFIENEKKSIIQYVYPDQRKITQEAFKVMLKDILDEAASCFQMNGLTQGVNAENFTNKPSMLQWQYIEQNMKELRTIFRKISEHPIRQLVQQDELLRRERVKEVTNKVIRWLEIYGPTYGSSIEIPPELIKVSSKQETYNVYENQVLLRNLIDLQTLLRKYKSFSPEIINKVILYIDWINNWKRKVFLKDIVLARGPIRITQVFQKHPMYRLWFNWFYDLYEFKDVKFDLKYKLSLKDTFVLYEMWCFMQIIKYVRQMNLLEDTTSLYMFEDQQYFIHLKENKESKVRLKDGTLIYFQRIIQSNSPSYYSYTQRMIPDIVIEKDGCLYILDPKYRIHANIHLALAEMHKYRDGILSRQSDEKVVKEVYILTPQQGKMSETKDFYNSEYKQKHKMGAFCISPGEESMELHQWLENLLRK